LKPRRKRLSFKSTWPWNVDQTEDTYRDVKCAHDSVTWHHIPKEVRGDDWVQGSGVTGQTATNVYQRCGRLYVSKVLWTWTRNWLLYPPHQGRLNILLKFWRHCNHHRNVFLRHFGDTLIFWLNLGDYRSTRNDRSLCKALRKCKQFSGTRRYRDF
jgi:hypothetical protein